MNTLFLPLLSKSINAYLRLDPESAQRLIKLKGRVITIELRPFHFIFQLAVTEIGVALETGELHDAATRITGTPLQLFGMMMNKDNRQQFFADDLKIEGDAELGQAIIQLFDEIHIDWEEHLAKFTGDVPAYHVGRFVRNIKQWINQTKDSFSDNITEYIHEEAEWFPTRESLNDYYNDIDKLRMDIDRLEARIMQIKANAQQENGQ